MSSIDLDDFERALSLAGSLDNDARHTLVSHAAMGLHLREPLAKALTEAAEEDGKSLEGGTKAFADLGGSPDDVSTLHERVEALRADLGNKTVDRALIRFGYAEGARLSPDGDEIVHGPAASKRDKAAIYGKPMPPSTALSLEQAKSHIGDFGYETIMNLAEPLKNQEIFRGYARKIAALLDASGVTLGEDGLWTEGSCDDLDALADRLTTLALERSEMSAELRHQTSRRVDRVKRMEFTLETLYDAGYHLDSDHELIPPD